MTFVRDMSMILVIERSRALLRLKTLQRTSHQKRYDSLFLFFLVSIHLDHKNLPRRVGSYVGSAYLQCY